MRTKEQKSEYDMRYAREHIKRKIIPFNIEQDDDLELLDWLNQQENITAYIKALIRADMEKD